MHIPLSRPLWACAAFAVAVSANAQTMWSSAGANSAAIQATVDAFRADLGTNNFSVTGSQGSGRREINWDGVPDNFSAPNNLPANFFNVNSPRGVEFSTSGTGFQTSANAGGATAVRFGNIDPSYSATFQTFSAQRLFTSLDSNVFDVRFFIPGSSQSAVSRAFGVVFTDVDLAATTSLTFFDANNASLGTFFAPTANGGLSFLGVTFGSSVISRVRVTMGNASLTAGRLDSNGNPNDLVVADDFIYAEPVPEPATMVALTLGVIAVIRKRRTP